MTTLNIETYSDADFSVVQNAAFAIVGNRLRMHVRKTAADPTVWLELTTDNGGLTITDATPDTVTVYIAQASLLNLPPGDYVHSCVMSSQGGSLRTEVWRGTFIHSAGPTRWAAGVP